MAPIIEGTKDGKEEAAADEAALTPQAKARGKRK